MWYMKCQFLSLPHCSNVSTEGRFNPTEDNAIQPFGSSTSASGNSSATDSS